MRRNQIGHALVSPQGDFLLVTSFENDSVNEKEFTKMTRVKVLVWEGTSPSEKKKIKQNFSDVYLRLISIQNRSGKTKFNEM